jgi:uncharacterized protein DUF11
VAAAVTVVLALPGSSAATPDEAARRPAAGNRTDAGQTPLEICIHVDVDGIVVVDVRIGGDCAPPATTTTTTTTPPPPPPPPPTTTTTAPPPAEVAPPTTTTTVPPPPPPPPSTTTTTTTTVPPTTTTTTPPPPRPPAPPPPRLTARVSVAPDLPVPGQPAVTTITVRNDGGSPAPALTLVDEVSPGAAVRSATAPGGSCGTAGHRATCELGTVPAGGQTTAEVRLLLEAEPVSRTLVQRVTLSTGGTSEAGTAMASTLLAPGESGPTLLALPGPTVTLVAFVGFVLAARSSR